jgi:hypothetical protein
MQIAKLCGLALLLALSASAQTDSSLEGVVHDPTGGVIVGAAVRVEHKGGLAQRTLTTDAAGKFRAIELPPGDYRLTVSAENFRTSVQEGIDLSAGRAAQVDLTLQIGPQQQEVLVVADAAPLSTRASGWGGLVDKDSLDSLPLNGRDLFELSILQPGATSPPAARTGLAQGLGLQISVNGARPNQNGFQIDGIWVNDATKAMPSSAAGSVLGLETVREIHMVSNPYSAQYGRTAGGLFEAVSASGSNQFHGALYEYFRNDALDAKNFFDSPDDPIPPLRRNQFGGVVSGPIVRNRAWFLFNYEALRQRLGRTLRPTVPSLDARQGVLPGPDGGIERVNVNPAVQPYLDLYPTPTGRDFGDGTAEAQRQASSSTDEDFLSGKVDLQLSDSMRLATRYTFSDALNREPEDMGIWTFQLGSRNHFFSSELQTILSPTAVMDLRVAYSRVNNSETSDLRGDIGPDLSFVQGQPLGTMTVTGLSDFGGFLARARPRTFALNSLQTSGDLSWQTGAHWFKAGAGVDRIRFNQRSDLSFVGSYTFNSLRNLLAGAPNIAEVADPSSDTARLWTYYQPYFFVEDEVRLHSNVSLNLGLRWEAASTPTEIDGKVATLPDFYRDAEPTLGGPLYTNPSWTNFAPRAGLAWSPFGDNRTVVRAGAGLFFDLLGSRELTIAGVRTPPFFNRILVFGRPRFPDILNAAAGRTPSASVDGLDYNLEQPKVWRWQLNLEQQVGRRSVARLGYSGMRGLHLMGQVGNVNTPIPQQLADGRWFFPDNVPRLNPAFSRIGLRRSQFNSFYHGLTASLERRLDRNLRYQVKYTFSKSIDEISSSTFNDFEASDQVPVTPDYRLNRGLSDFDLRHVFAGNVSYLLPRMEGSARRWLLGGWEVHALSQLQSGNPFAPSVGFDQARLLTGFGDTGQRPDLARPGANLILGGPDQYFDPTGFSLPQPGFLGTLGRGTLRGPGLFTLDVGAHKRFSLTERQAITFRAEIFNITNEANFQIPSGQELFTQQGGRIGSAGRITSTATPARQIQLALRWEF